VSFDMRALGFFSMSFGSGVELLVSFDMAVRSLRVVRDIGVGLSALGCCTLLSSVM